MSDEKEELMEEFETVTLTDEEGCEIEFAIIDTITDNGNTYILAVETEMLDDEEAEAALFKKAVSDEDGEDIYEIIEDDDEFDRIAGLFQVSGDEYDVEIDD
ncbi:DUF1292 domain-containing protein [Lachnospiraceae bacterium NSJ-143]|nr:DUF1292 domain-containing protein [Lachnospiraceae bacterium NSJ-143]